MEQQLHFIMRLDCVMNAIASFKTVRIKINAREWFDGEIAEKIHTRDKLKNCMLMKKTLKRRET